MIYSEKTKLSKWKLIPPLHKQILQLRGGRSFPPKVGPRLGFEGLSDPDFFFSMISMVWRGVFCMFQGGAPRWCLAYFFRKTSPNRLEGKFFRGAVMNFQRFVSVLVKQLWQFVLNDLMILISDAQSWVVHPTPTKMGPGSIYNCGKKNDRYPYKWVFFGVKKPYLFSGVTENPMKSTRSWASQSNTPGGWRARAVLRSQPPEAGIKLRLEFLQWKFTVEKMQAV